MHMQSKVCRNFLPALIAGLTILSLPAAAHAGEKIAWASAQQQHQQLQQPSYEKLKYSPNLAYIPTYTGKLAVNTEAVHYTGLPTGECYNLKYLMKEDPSIVRDWYVVTLRQCGWTVDDTFPCASSITATRNNGLTCYIYTRPAQQSGYACEMILRFAIRPN